jgi:hypothetical protein
MVGCGRVIDRIHSVSRITRSRAVVRDIGLCRYWLRAGIVTPMFDMKKPITWSALFVYPKVSPANRDEDLDSGFIQWMQSWPIPGVGYFLNVGHQPWASFSEQNAFISAIVSKRNAVSDSSNPQTISVRSRCWIIANVWALTQSANSLVHLIPWFFCHSISCFPLTGKGAMCAISA